MSSGTPPVALTIAGSDSGGGAGIQADLKTFYAFGVFGTTAVTAVTAQDTRCVRAVHPVPPEMVRAQIDAVVEDLAPAAAKTGMLATARLVATVAEALRRHGPPPLVVDPVMASSGGRPLLADDARGTLARDLVPLATLVTPNLAEAALLTGRRVTDVHEMEDAARALVDLGAGAALVTGGHLADGPEIADVLWDGSELRTWRHPRVSTPHTHGTGCTLSAAVTAGLARGIALDRAVERAVEYVSRALRGAPGLGRGHGPLDHFAPTE